jgi:acetyl esterase/lipase
MEDPEITAIRHAWAELDFPTDVEGARRTYDAFGANYGLAPDVVITPVTMAGVPAEWSSTEGAADDAAVLYLHGGGYFIGSLASHRHVASELGRAAGARALAIDYRLAPEHPFPAALDDAVAAYEAMLADGLRPERIALAGDSAGGGLAIATLVALRDRGTPLPACAFCISPLVDLAATGGSMETQRARDPMIAREGVLGAAAMYLNGVDPRTPLASPMHADLSGLPPLLIHVGSAETLLDDAVRLAGVAGAADVRVTLEVHPGMIHVWHFFHPALAAGRRALGDGGSFIRMHIGS